MFFLFSCLALLASVARRHVVLMLLSLASALLLPTGVGAQSTPLPSLEKNVPLRAIDEPAVRNKFAAADEAFAAGLTEPAAGIYESLSRELPQSSPLYERALTNLASCLLERNDPVGAIKILEPLPISPARQIRLAIARAIRGIPMNGDELKAIPPAAISPSDLPWYNIAHGLLALSVGKADEAESHFVQAREYYVRGSQAYQRMHVRMLQYLAKIQLGSPLSAHDMELIRNDVTLNENNAHGFAFTKQLAIAHARNGRIADAVAVLRQQNTSPGERDETNLLIGFILPPDKREAREALYAVIDRKTFPAPELKLLAITRLASIPSAFKGMPQTVVEVSNEIFRKLSDTSETTTNDDVLAALNITCAKLKFAINDNSAAEQAANDVLLRTPNSEWCADALRILATCAWRKGAYRRAANFLAQLQKELPKIAEPRKAGMALVIADCLFLAARETSLSEDYASAGAAYASAPATPLTEGNILFMRVQCELLANKAESASAILAAARPSPTNTPDIHRSEWALVEWLRTHQRAPEAAVRLDAHLIAHPEMDVEFRVRFLWQRTLIAFASDKNESAARTTEELVNIVEKATSPGIIAQRNAILGKITLLRARAILPSNPAAAHTIFEELREKYPSAEAAAASYLVEGRARAAARNHREALRIFLAAYERYKGAAIPELANYAAWALYEAAGQQMALVPEETPISAIATFEKFVQEYPRHLNVDLARFRQADIYRLINHFDDAHLIYEELIRKLPENSPGRWRAEIGVADCHNAKAMTASSTSTARANDFASDLNKAIEAYARLFSLSEKIPDLRAEAGYKWCSALAARRPNPQDGGRTRETITREADEARMQVHSQLIRDEDSFARLGPTGRYWVCRTLRELATSYLERKEPQSFEKARNVYRLLDEYNRNTHGTPNQVLPFRDDTAHRVRARPINASSLPERS
ncbi:MAG: hypothetical protein LBD01_00030 [Puniceicoccales bacterium]|jgi:TolA-binding protein|nr:hypothetical protein [Puniceicoccales bacterium]